MDYLEENFQKLQEYVRALEDERLKVEMFQRELPLCLDIVTRTIESCKQRLSGGATTTTTITAQGSQQTTSEGLVFEEFIPLKKTCSSTPENEEDEDDYDELGSHKNSADGDSKSSPEKKLDWLSSVQLWNQSPDPSNELPKKVAVVEVMRNGGAFQPFQKEMETVSGDPPAAAAAPSTSGCSTSGQQSRKSRRSWSHDLHKKFLNALDQLGGSHAATPKQIRDLMKVDGLTNDEVKSHLQKYRLHSRRPSPSSAVHNGTAAPTQLVVLGGIWMGPPPPPPPPAEQPEQQRPAQSQGNAAASRCNTLANSSSTCTVTASRAY